MLHPVEPGNRTATGSGHFVNLGFRVNVRPQKQRGGTTGCLGGHPQRFVSVETDLDPPLRRRAYRAQEKSDAAGTQRRGGGHVFFLNDQRFPNLIEQSGRGRQRLCLSAVGGQAGHRLPNGHGGVGHDTDDRDIAAELLGNIGNTDTGDCRENEMSAGPDGPAYGIEQANQLPRLNRDQHGLTTADGLGVIRRNTKTALLEFIQRCHLPPGQANLRRIIPPGGGQPAGNRLPDISPAEDGNALREPTIFSLSVGHSSANELPHLINLSVGGERSPSPGPSAKRHLPGSFAGSSGDVRRQGEAVS